MSTLPIDMEPAGLLKKLQDFAAGYRVLDRGEQKEAHSLTEGVRKLLDNKRGQLLLNSGNKCTALTLQVVLVSTYQERDWQA